MSYRPADLLLIECHDAASHDGGVAVFDAGSLIALSSERVDRIKHSKNFQPAYDHVLQHVALAGKTVHDFCHPQYEVGTINHPLAHAASAFYPSGFKESLILVVDGQGPYDDGRVVSLTVWAGDGNSILELAAYPEPLPLCRHSLGHFYSAITYYLGFGFYDQGKTMALSAYGTQALTSIIDELCATVGTDIRTDWKFIETVFYEVYGETFGWSLPVDHDYHVRLYERLLGPIRKRCDPLIIRQFDIAFACQRRVEDIMVECCSTLREHFRCDNLCLAGGVALNVAVNSRIIKEAGFQNVFIQPAAGDDGQALGRLLHRMHQQFDIDRDEMQSASLGPLYPEGEVSSAVLASSAKIEYYMAGGPRELSRDIAQRLARGEIVAWWQGRSELGPRALGNRSILADPRDGRMRTRLNLAVKHRELFQPYALSILATEAPAYFHNPIKSPFMLLRSLAKETASKMLPAGLHVDGTSRLQTVTQENNGIFFDLISQFHILTGSPAVLNTSFNDRGEPIVETPQNAIDSFLRMDGLDVLALGPYVVTRQMGGHDSRSL